MPMPEKDVINVEETTPVTEEVVEEMEDDQVEVFQNLADAIEAFANGAGAEAEKSREEFGDEGVAPSNPPEPSNNSNGPMGSYDIEIKEFHMNPTEEKVMNLLQDECYVNGASVDRIEQQRLANIAEIERLQNTGKISPDEAKAEMKKAEEEWLGAVQRLCHGAPKYSKGVGKSILKRQLRIEDQGHMQGGEVKLYVKTKNPKTGKMEFKQKIYGQNHVGEINKIVRAHEKRVVEEKSRHAHMQKDKVGQGAKQFANGDAESMFKGSVSMGMHTLLYLLNRMAQAGHAGAQFALYQYALHRATTNDLKALEKAMNDLEKVSDELEQETQTTDNKKEDCFELMAGDKKEVALDFDNPPTKKSMGEYLNSFESGKAIFGATRDLANGRGDLPPFDQIYWQTTEAAPGVTATMGAFFDKSGVLSPVAPFFDGNENDIRNMFAMNGMSEEEIDKAMEENDKRRETYKEMERESKTNEKGKETAELEGDAFALLEDSKGDDMGEENLLSGPTLDDDDMGIDLGDEGFEV